MVSSGLHVTEVQKEKKSFYWYHSSIAIVHKGSTKKTMFRFLKCVLCLLILILMYVKYYIIFGLG